MVTFGFGQTVTIGNFNSKNQYLQKRKWNKTLSSG
jgi:hypothetical protein